MISKNAKYYCREDISKIKGYADALADTTRIWECHHWNEQWFTKSELIKLGRYYNVPADELVFMSKKEHRQWHCKYGAEQKEARRKVSEAIKGQPKSEEWKNKQSIAKKGHSVSEETKRKIGEANRGKTRSAEAIKKASEANRGKTRSAETKQKISEARKAYWIRRKAK